MRREIWIDDQDSIVRYNLAYINPLIYSGDNGRVVGYDSAHGHHHRHYKGKISTVSLSRFEEIEAQFQGEWSRLAKEAEYAKD